ncbi:hypothetical protein ACPEGK_29720, partial [Klebsiella sp. K794]|uniref:hypothetical protein n=1 Tax=Klebsiella sp. K794 TaxID=3369402 RepID=UPI003C304AE0
IVQVFGRFIRGLTKTCNSVTAKVNVRFWHKAEIRRSGTFRESCGAINLQHVVRSGCNVVVN